MAIRPYIPIQVISIPCHHESFDSTQDKLHEGSHVYKKESLRSAQNDNQSKVTYEVLPAIRPQPFSIKSVINFLREDQGHEKTGPIGTLLDDEKERNNE